MTIDFCKELDKPYMENPGYLDIMQFCEYKAIRTVNIAGNRGSKLTKEQKIEIYAILECAFKLINDL